MKIITTVIITLLFCSHSFGQWTALSSGTNYQLQEVYFLNQDTGFVVGLDKIFKTSDGGNSWQTVHLGSQIISGVYFSNNTNGYAVGIDASLNKSTILQSTDGGNNWTPTNLVVSENLTDVFFLNTNIGFTVGGNGTLFKTTDGGINWNPLTTGTTDVLNSVFFTDSQNGIIVGGPVVSPLILKTSNGGSSWNTISSPATNFLQSVFFPSALIGYAVGSNGEIIKTIDGGSNWIAQTPAAVYGNVDVFFTDDLTGYVVGGSTNFTGIQKTIDGGQTWFTQSASTIEGLIGVFFPTPTVGYAVGDNGIIIKTANGGGVGIADFNPEKIEISAYPNPFINELTLSIDQRVDQMNITIFDLTGKIIYHTISTNSNEKINLASLSQGTYFLVVETKKDKVVQKIMKS